MLQTCPEMFAKHQPTKPAQKNTRKTPPTKPAQKHPQPIKYQRIQLQRGIICHLIGFCPTQVEK
jgi:hypothetical protein